MAIPGPAPAAPKCGRRGAKSGNVLHRAITRCAVCVNANRNTMNVLGGAGRGKELKTSSVGGTILLVNEDHRCYATTIAKRAA